MGAYAEQTIVPVHFLIPLPDNISYEIAAASLLKGLTARFLIRQTFQVKAITHGQRCHVVYDSIGKMTFPGSLDCLRPFGCFVSFGFSSGLIPPFDILTLLEKGSLYATWPGLTTYLSKRSDVLSMSKEFFDIISNNIIKIQSPLQLSLEHATEAHQKLESRKLTKDTVMIP